MKLSLIKKMSAKTGLKLGSRNPRPEVSFLIKTCQKETEVSPSAGILVVATLTQYWHNLTTAATKLGASWHRWKLTDQNERRI